MSEPSSEIVPAKTGTRPATALTRVDLPAPFGPRMATSSPRMHRQVDAAHDRQVPLVAGDQAARRQYGRRPVMPGRRRDRLRRRPGRGRFRPESLRRDGGRPPSRRRGCKAATTASMLCSMSRIDVPARLRSRMRPMISSSRVGLTPAAGSSSRIACGSAIRIRASSRSLRWPPDRTRAGSFSSADRVTKSSKARALATRARSSCATRAGRRMFAHMRSPVWFCPPASTFSSTVISANGLGI